LSETLPHARVVTVPGAGHMGPLTHADVVNAAIVEWLA
jgi:pimeloyl-ACP methyl ester carboxylesterase